MDINYDKLGFKSGLEIHQQLEADGKKLFCRCPSLLRKDEPDFTVERRLHAIAGESGEIDVAVKHEAVLDKKFVYQGYKDTTCLVELDEEPPREINEEALKVALHISLLLNCRIQTISQIMRKTVIDGSNTSGFQRTVLIAHDGYVELSSGKKIGIETVILEEDAARIVNDENKSDNVRIYRLDRLGIPLVEIATSPDISTPSEAKETALLIGKILRTCKVRRGLGTIRQDVNMSIKNGSRVEIKGFQDIRNVEKTLEKEIERQIVLVKEKKSVKEVRQALPDFSTKFLRPMPGAARMYPETDLPLLKISKKMIDDAKKTLPKIISKGDLEDELKREGLSNEMIKLLLKCQMVDEFKELLQISGIKKADLIVKMLILFPKEIATKEKKNLEDVKELLNEDVLIEILKRLKEKKISERDVKDVMIEIVKGKELNEALKVKKVDMIGVGVEEKIHKLIKSKPGLSANAYMGLVMKDESLKGIGGKRAMEIIGKFVG